MGSPTAAAYAIANFSGALTGTFASATLPTGYALDYGTTGQIRLVQLPGYATWAAANAGGAFHDDFDGDGVKNGIEYFMGETGSTFTAIPTVTNGMVSYPRDSSATGVSFKVRTSPDLSVWTDVSGTADLSDPQFVKYTLPAGPGKLFVRLEVAEN